MITASSYNIRSPKVYRDSVGTHVYVRDWQGNIRAVVRKGPDGKTILEQATYYYPYGMPMAESTNPTANRYKYTGKELLTDHGVNIMDYGPRPYDPTTGTWWSVDEHSADYAPMSHYSMCAGDPINHIDPNGMWFVNVSCSENRGRNPYATFRVYDRNENLIYKTIVKVFGTSRDRTQTNADTPTGIYEIKGWKETGKYLEDGKYYKIDSYGINPLLALEYKEGEAYPDRQGMHVHGGGIVDYGLKGTLGCIRISDDDILELKNIVDKLQESDPKDKPEYLRVENDLTDPVDYSEKDVYKILQEFILAGVTVTFK